MKELAEESLEHTPTWAVAAVCIVFIALSMLMQRGLQRLGKWLLDSDKKSLYQALKKMKEELMLLGFISLLLTVAQNPVSKFCMPASWALNMLPCHFPGGNESDTAGTVLPPSEHTPIPGSTSPLEHERSTLSGTEIISRHVHRRLQSNIRKMLEFSFQDRHESSSTRRLLAAGHICPPGRIPVMSTESLHQLHIFIFVMAVVHVFYSCVTMLFGFTKLRSWRKWEEETRADNYNYTAEIRKSFDEEGFSKMQFRKIGFGSLRRQSTFVTSRTMSPWSATASGIWINSFFRQFGKSIAKSDYLTLRFGFIKTHNAPMHLNFHRYIMSSLQDDLKTVIGISGYLWFFVIFFMVLNVHGWYAYFWMSFVPILINLVIGTKLQHVITQLAMETAQVHGILGCTIKPRDELFWFNKPHVLLYFIHFILFQNAFELAFCIWLVTTFGFNSCFFDKHGFITARVVVGILAQVLCSYSTLPLYALVSQMGSHYKRAIFADPVSNAVTDWRNKACSKAAKFRHNLSNPDHQHQDHDHKDGQHLITANTDGCSHTHLSLCHEHQDIEGKPSTFSSSQSQQCCVYSADGTMTMSNGIGLTLMKGSSRSDAATVGSSLSQSRIESLDCFPDHHDGLAAGVYSYSAVKCCAKCERITLTENLSNEENEGKRSLDEEGDHPYGQLAHMEPNFIHMRISRGETIDGRPLWSLECNECKSMKTLTLDASGLGDPLRADNDIIPMEGSPILHSCKQFVFLRIVNPWSHSHVESLLHESQGDLGQEVEAMIKSNFRLSSWPLVSKNDQCLPPRAKDLATSTTLQSLFEVKGMPVSSGSAAGHSTTIKQHLEIPLEAVAPGDKATCIGSVNSSNSEGKAKSSQSCISKARIETRKDMLQGSPDATLFLKQQPQIMKEGIGYAAAPASDKSLTFFSNYLNVGTVPSTQRQGVNDGKFFTKSASFATRSLRSSSTAHGDDDGRRGGEIVIPDEKAKLAFRKSASFTANSS